MQLGCVWNSPTPDFLYFLKHISLLVSIFVYASGHLPLLLFILSKKKKNIRLCNMSAKTQAMWCINIVFTFVHSTPCPEKKQYGVFQA